MHIEAVIFDMDGVLLDSERAWDEVREALVRDRGGRWHPGAQRDMMGMSSSEWPAYMRDALGVPMEPAAILRHVTDALAAGYRAQVPLLPGAAAAVRRIARRWPIAVASSSPAELIEVALAAAGLRPLFGAVVSSEEVGPGKPAPDVYLRAAALLAADPRRCAAVEDSTNGIRAAVAAGMRTIVVPNPDYPPHPDVVRDAQVVLTGIAGLTEDVVTGTAGR